MIGRAISLLLSLFILIPSSSGFAAWLKCSRRLEEDEIIMNNKVKQAHVGDPVKLAVYDESGSRVDVPSDENNGDTIVWIDSSSSSLSFIIRMDPESVKELSDVQYVVETAPFNESKGVDNPSMAPSHSHPSPTPMIPTVSAPPDVSAESSFIDASTGGGIICNGRRAHARGKKGSVTYELVPKISSNQKDDSDGIRDDSIISQVVGGYSEYHGPVTLTPCVLFKRKEKQAETTMAGQGEL